MSQINKIYSGSPLWSDPRNVNTLSHSSLCLEHDPLFQGKPNPDLITRREAVQPQNRTFKKTLHGCLNCFSALLKELSHILYLSFLKPRQKTKHVL